MNTIPPLRKWVLLNKYFIRTSESKEVKSKATHFLLDGGLWNIPKNDYITFLRLLATDLQNGIKYYISENRTEIFRFVCDLDFYEDSIITVPQIERVVAIINKIVSEYYSQNTVIICGTESKTKGEYIKSGFHLIWPKIWISVEKAMELRLKIVDELISTFGQRELHNTWEDVVDLAIYKDNGLRMVGCRKIVKCKCILNEKEKCEKCNGTGKVDEGRVYKPVSVLGNQGNIDFKEYLTKIQNDYYLLLLDTAIYNYSSFSETKLLKLLPITTIPEVVNCKRNESPELNKKIENFIRKTFKSEYSKINVKKVTKAENSKYFIEIDNNYCMNVGRNHTSSAVYFQIKPSGICQRCFCKKDTTYDRLAGPCKNYSSKEHSLSKPLQSYLFGACKKIIKFDLTTKDFESTRITGIKNNKLENTLLNCRNMLSQLENDLLK